MTTNSGADARATLKEAITGAGITYADHGDRFNAPGVVVLADDPWNTPSDTYSERDVNLVLYAVTGTALTRDAILSLESLIDDVTGALYDLTDLVWSSPTSIQLGNSIYLASIAHITL